MNRLESIAKYDERYNGWFYFTEFYITSYIRITKRYISNVFQPTIDLASISVHMDQQRRGYCTRFLDSIEKIADSTGRIVYVESIVNPHLARMLSTRGYMECGIDSSSMYRPN